MHKPDLVGIPDKIIDRIIHGKHGNSHLEDLNQPLHQDPLETSDGLQEAMMHTSRRFGKAPWRHSNVETMLGNNAVGPNLTNELVVDGNQLGEQVATIMQQGVTRNGELNQLRYDAGQQCIRPVGKFDFITPPPSIPHVLTELSHLNDFVGNELNPWLNDVSSRLAKNVLSMLRHPGKTIMDTVEEVWPYVYILALMGDPIRKMNEQRSRIRQGLPVDEEAMAITVEDAMRYVTGTPKRSQEHNALVNFVTKWSPKVLAFASMSGWADEKLDNASLALTGAHPVRNARRAPAILGAKALPALNGFTIRKSLDARLFAEEVTTAQTMYNAFAQGYERAETLEVKNERDAYTRVWAHVMRDPFNANLGYHMPIVGSPNLYKAFRKSLAELESKASKGNLSADEQGRLRMGRLLRDSALSAMQRATDGISRIIVPDYSTEALNDGARFMLARSAEKATGENWRQLVDLFYEGIEPKHETVTTLFDYLAQEAGYPDYATLRESGSLPYLNTLKSENITGEQAWNISIAAQLQHDIEVVENGAYPTDYLRQLTLKGLAQSKGFRSIRDMRAAIENTRQSDPDLFNESRKIYEQSLSDNQNSPTQN